jgi:hypothetical protein
MHLIDVYSLAFICCAYNINNFRNKFEDRDTIRTKLGTFEIGNVDFTQIIICFLVFKILIVDFV